MKQNIEIKLIYVYALLFVIGMIGYTIPSLKSLIHKTTEVFLFVTAIPVLIVLYFHQKRKIQYIAMVFSLVGITIIIEILGVQTGDVFGNYVYGDTFQLKIYQVPVIIGINWCVLIMAANTILKRFIGNSYVLITLSALLIVGFDVLLEPVAMKLDYWQWEGNVIPFQNYIAWFGISWLAGFALKKANIKLSSKLMVSYFIYQMILFLYLHILLITSQNQGLV